MRCLSEAICSRMGPRAGQRASGMCSAALLWKLLAGHLGNLPPKDLTAPRTWLTSFDQLRAGTHQCLTRADDGHMGLGVFAPMFERVQELRVKTRQASQVLGVDLVGLALVGVDELHF